MVQIMFDILVKLYLLTKIYDNFLQLFGKDVAKNFISLEILGCQPRVKSKNVLLQGSKILHGLLTHKNIRISNQNKNLGTPSPLTPALYYIWADKGGISKVVLGFQNFGYYF